MDAFEMFELEKLRPLIERCQLQEHRCIICGSPTTGFGVFTPDNERNFRLGAPTGKTRYVAYGLSHLHSSVPTDVIEAALANDFHKYAAAHYITVLGDCQQTTFKHLHEAWASLAGRVAKPLRGKCEEN